MKHTPIPAVQSAPSVTEIEFCAWVAQALPSDRLEYHRGFLVLDTFPVFSSLEAEAREALRKLADRTFHVAEQGLVHLVQERVGPDFYPEGVEGLFEIYYAPADTFETVNTLGLPLYARSIPDRDRDEWVRLEIESNPLPICTRPQVLRSARRT